MNNKNFIFKSFFLTKLYVKLTNGKKITQGPYNVVELIQRFSNLEYDDESFKEELINVAYNYGKYGFHVDEYFYYGLKYLSHAGKIEFINEETRWNYYDKLNDSENYSLFDNKEKTYNTFKKFYKRDIVAIYGENHRNVYNDFVQKYDDIILKPENSSGGKGVRLLNKDTDSFDNLIVEYKNGFIMEPVLKNAGEFAEFHRQSLNTIRIATVRLDDRVEIPFAFARFGSYGRAVDNFSSNGIICSIDIDTGIIYATFTKNMKRCIIHPDSKKTILGFKIPCWEELVSTVKELAYVVPTNRYTGWDMAYTENGWVMIEANARGQFVNQMPGREGIKKKIEGYIKEIENGKSSN